MYNLVSSVISDAYLQSDTQSYSVTEANNVTQAPNLSCSFSGKISINYTLSGYNGSNVPSFVSINSQTGVLSIQAPNVSSSIPYSFYIESKVSGVADVVKKIINLNVKKCTASNCVKCSATDSTVCTSCNSGYNLDSGAWNLPETEIAKSLSVGSQAIVGAIVVISFISSLSTLSSLASLWSMINQLQILNLFLVF